MLWFFLFTLYNLIKSFLYEISHRLIQLFGIFAQKTLEILHVFILPQEEFFNKRWLLSYRLQKSSNSLISATRLALVIHLRKK